MMRWELRRDGRTMSLRATLLAVALVPACGGGGAGDAADAPDAATSPGPDGATVVDAIVADAAPPDATPLPIVTTGSITAGFGHTCVLHPTGRVKCWGQGGQGQLGLGDTTSRGDAPGELGADLPAVDLGTDRYATALAGGGNHTCALLDDHRVKCWGYATDGQLGLGDVDARGDGPGEMGDALPTVDLGAGRTALAITAGMSHTCALLDDHSVKCWGSSASGQLGHGDTQARGDQPGEMGDALPAVDVGPLDAAAIGAGAYFSCVTSIEGDVACWGASSEGQLGNGSTQTRGDGPGEMGAALPRATFGALRHVATLGVGEFHSCAVLDDASLKCFGAGNGGQLGLGDALNRGDQPGEMGDALPTVDLGVGRTALHLAFTQSDVCALLDDETVKCWGYNFYGVNGNGTTAHLGDGPDEMGDALAPVPLPAGRAIRQVVGGGEHMCVLFEDEGVRCWGFGGWGQLGQGNTESIGDGAGEVQVLADVDLGW
jgi:alpha-tubulin suppressor-like RCC1 family protein